MGAAVIFLVPERSKVPAAAARDRDRKTTPATNSKIEQTQKLHFRYAEVGVNSFRYVGEADSVAKPEAMVALANNWRRLSMRESFGANLANAVPFLDLMGYESFSLGSRCLAQLAG